MLRRLRSNGPAVLVPAIWSVVAGAHLVVAVGLAGAGQTAGIVAAVVDY